MAGLDILCLVVYFAAVGGIAYWSSRTSRADSRSYFLGGGTVGWIAIGASLFASNISTEHFIGLTGSGATSGLAVGQFEWLACLILLLLGWLFVPFYQRAGVFTMPEFLQVRYNAHCRTYLSAISLIAYVFTKVSVTLYAGGLVLREVLGWNIYVGAIVLVLATGVYTAFGGLRAVLYTDLFQAFVLILGSIFLTVAAITKVGGLHAMVNGVDSEFFNLWKSFDHPDFPWTGILFGAPILGIWYWCTDQMIVQRTLATSDVHEARKGTIFAGYLKILPVFILVLPGIAGRILFPKLASGADANPDMIYPAMIKSLLPMGVRGLVIAAVLAALMSSLSSVFNSSSTLVVMDFYKRIKTTATERQLVRAGQVATAVLVMVGLLWVPFIGIMSNQLYVYLQSVQAYIAPPIAAVFLLGILWKRISAAGALTTLLVGFALGAARFILELCAKAGWMTSLSANWYSEMNFLHFAILLFVVSIAVLVAVSTMGSAVKSPNWLIGVVSFVLVLIVLAMWAYFSPLVFHS